VNKNPQCQAPPRTHKPTHQPETQEIRTVLCFEAKPPAPSQIKPKKKNKVLKKTVWVDPRGSPPNPPHYGVPTPGGEGNLGGGFFVFFIDEQKRPQK